jgi:hypothetical protein
MSLLTVARYRAITGDIDTANATVSALIDEAEELLADALERPLESAERTERLWPDRNGMLWPRATPITDPGGFTQDGLGLKRWPFPNVFTAGDGAVEVTYTGGWVERSANPSATNRLPVCVERDLAFAAQRLATADGSSFPPGATSVTLGDASVSFGPDGAPSGPQGPQWSRQTLRYRYRRAWGV